MKCELCGLEFVEDSPEDQKTHQRRHDTVVNGPRTKATPGILVVTPETRGKLFDRVQWASNRLLHLDFGGPDLCDGRRAYLLVDSGRVVSYVLAGSVEIETKPYRAIFFAWTPLAQRQKGFARRLIAKALEDSEHREIAWCAPLTGDGEALAVSVSGPTLARFR